MQARAFNPQIFLELLCYSTFGGLMFHLVDSEKYLSYVTPRMKPYLYFTTIVMLIWACVGLGRLFRPQHKIRSAHCFVLVFPILLLLLPHNPLSTADLSDRYIGGKTFSGFTASTGIPAESPPANSADPTKGPSAMLEDDLPEAGTTPAEDRISASPEPTVPDPKAGVLQDEDAANLPGLDIKNQKITVANEDFGLWLSEIYINMEKYKGYQVIMTGFVFRNPEILKEDEFIPARPMMSCCAADLAPAGLVCKYDKASELKADSWVTVEGTLYIGEYEYGGVKYDDPQVAVTKITPAEAVEGYVYPY